MPGETDLATIAAPDGTSVSFCRGGEWHSDFAPTGRSPHAEAGITRTDHVALTQPFDHFDEALLFYRSVLGLDRAPETEYAAPFGLVRTRAVASPDRTVRVALSVALLRRGDWAPGVPDPQHVAFATDDVIASAAVMRQLGAPLLDVPDNYYADLATRLAPDPELLGAMREYGVLYDRDEHGELLHVYTEILGSRVFFEVVQRVGDHDGLGAANSPVRMAAHRRQRLARTT